MRVLLLAILLCASTAHLAHAESYPRDAVQSFMENCVQLKRELIPACSCIIKDMQKSIPFAEYEKLIVSPEPMKDARLAVITDKCVKAR